MKYILKDNFELIQDSGTAQEVVALKPCFPFLHPEEFLSIRNSKGKELKLLKDLNHLDTESKQAIKDYLNFRNYRMEIESVIKIVEEYGMRNWVVSIKGEERSFQTELTVWPKVYGDDLVVISLDGDIYSLDTTQLDKKTMKWVFPFLN